jgi:DNA polymerase III epsilon subunit-like protein
MKYTYIYNDSYI